MLNCTLMQLLPSVRAGGLDKPSWVLHPFHPDPRNDPEAALQLFVFIDLLHYCTLYTTLQYTLYTTV